MLVHVCCEGDGDGGCADEDEVHQSLGEDELVTQFHTRKYRTRG